MPAPTMENASRSSKTAKKKAAARSAKLSESPTVSSSVSIAADAPVDSQDDGFESPHIRDLQKHIRNLNKKIANASKTDTILSQHRGKSLDELVAAKIINADQKAQILKKPDLLALVAQHEEQLAQHLKAKEHYKQKLARAQKTWEKSRDQIKADAVREAEEAFQNTLQRNLLIISQFLRLAAHRRGEGKDPESEESQAIEGLLIAIYSGDSNAVTAMIKLIQGSQDHIQNPPDEPLPLSYSHIKCLASEHNPMAAPDPAPAEEAEASRELATDPTIAHATSNELAAGEDLVLTNGASQPSANGIANATISDDGANAIAESHWDAEHDISTAQDWVNVSVVRDPND